MHFIQSYDDDDDDYNDSYNKDYGDKGGKGTNRYYDDDDDYYRHIPEAPKSKKDAENAIQEARQDKKFWNYNEVDNSVKLQGAIDILFNCKPGNDYKVEFNDNQTGTRLIINCRTCNKILSSIDPFISHEQGKAHRKAQTAVLQPKDPNLSVPLKPRKLNEPRHIFTEGSLEEMIDETNKTAIGVHFSYKEVIDEETLYTCTLCEKERPVKRIKKDEMFKHLTNDFHMKKYLMVKFGCAKKSIAKLEEEAINIEELEGKIHRDITDFTNQLPDDVKWPLKGKRGCSREKRPVSPSSSYKSYSPSRKSRRSNSPRSCSREKRPVSPSSSYKSYSPSRKSRRSNSPRSSRHSMSPFQYRRSRSRSFSPSPPVACPPPPSIPVMVDKETLVKPSEFCAKPIMKEIECLARPETQPEALEQVTDDPHMQGMLIAALWTLTHKVDKYYQKHEMTSIDIKTGKKVYLIGCTNKMKECICKLKLLETLDEMSN